MGAVSAIKRIFKRSNKTKRMEKEKNRETRDGVIQLNKSQRKRRAQK